VLLWQARCDMLRGAARYVKSNTQRAGCSPVTAVAISAAAQLIPYRVLGVGRDSHLNLDPLMGVYLLTCHCCSHLCCRC
jgi:hypothetical protein